MGPILRKQMLNQLYVIGKKSIVHEIVENFTMKVSKRLKL
jgi:hypothetical protein